MNQEIETIITESLGKPTDKLKVEGRTHLKYFKQEKCEFSFIISQNHLSFLLNGTGPILQDNNIKTKKEARELLEEILVILKNPISQINYLIGDQIKKTKFEYFGLIGNDIVQLTYTGGKFTILQLFQKKDQIRIDYQPWIN